MADSTIANLPSASTLGNNDLFVIEQGGAAKKLAADKLASKAELASHTEDVNIHVLSSQKLAWNAKQDAITSNTDLIAKTITAGITYVTSAPTQANTNGIKIAVLASAPATKYDGWLYIITGE